MIPIIIIKTHRATKAESAPLHYVCVHAGVCACVRTCVHACVNEMRRTRTAMNTAVARSLQVQHYNATPKQS